MGLINLVRQARGALLRDARDIFGREGVREGVVRRRGFLLEACLFAGN